MLTSKTLIPVAIGMAEMIKIENESRIQELVNKHWDAMNLPRKKKKKVRKQVDRDLEFEIIMKAQFDRMFGAYDNPVQE